MPHAEQGANNQPTPVQTQQPYNCLDHCRTGLLIFDMDRSQTKTTPHKQMKHSAIDWGQTWSLSHPINTFRVVVVRFVLHFWCLIEAFRSQALHFGESWSFFVG